MEKLKTAWHCFRRDEQWMLVGLLSALAFFGAYALAKRQSTPPLPPVFQNAPVLADNSVIAENAVSASASNMVLVHVAGEVNKPGVLELPASARVVDAVRKAGGPTQDGDYNALNLAALVKDGDKIEVPKRGAPPSSTVTGAEKPAESTPSGSSPAPAVKSKPPQLSGPINVNSADAAQLDLLPGVGPATAAKIIEYRQQNGAFRSLEDLDKVKGLGPVKIEKMKPYVVF